MSVKKIAVTGILTSIAVILGIVEGFIPSVGIPGVKLGLANICILITLYAFDWKYALGVNLLRVILTSLLRGTIFQIGFLMSLTGAFLSFLIMVILKLTIKKMHIITISVIGAIFHILGQIIIAALYLQTTNIWFYFPFLALSAIITGIFVGFVSDRCLLIPFFKKEKRD